MTIMADEDEDSDCLYIDEREEPASPEKPKTEQNRTKVTDPVSNKKRSDLRNIRKKSAELPPVNYLPLMRNYTLNTIKNNLLNASKKPRITIKDFARIPDANSNETNDSALYALLSESATNSQSDLDHTAVPMDNEAFRAEAQKKDLRVADTWVPTSNTYEAIPTAPDQREPTHTIHTYMDTPHDFNVPRMPPNAYEERPIILPNVNSYEVPNGNILPHSPTATKVNSTQASVIVPNSGNLSGGTMAYPPSNQVHNGKTNFPTANNWPVQNGQTQHIVAHDRHHNCPPEYNHATANYQRAQPPNNCPPGYPCCRLPMNMSALPLNHHHYNPRPPPPPYMYAIGTSCNGQRLDSASPRVTPNAHYFPWNGYGQYGTNSIPQNAPHGNRDNAAYLAEMHKQAYLQRNSFRMDSMRTETTHVVSSAHANQKPGVEATNKRTYTKISTNNTQVVTNNSEITATYNAMGSGAINIPNWDAFGNGETTAKKRTAKPKTNTLKVKATIPVNNQIHSPSNIQQTRNNIEVPSINLTSKCTQPSMNIVPNVIQPPLNTMTHLPPTTIRTIEPANITTVSHYIDIADEVQVPINKEGTLKPIAIKNNNYEAPTDLMKAQNGAINMNINRGQPIINPNLSITNDNREEAHIPLLIVQSADMTINTNKAKVETTMHNSTKKKLQNGAFIQPSISSTNRPDALTLLDKDNDRAHTDVTTPKTLLQSSSNAYGVNVTTSTTTKKISHNIESNEVLRSNTVNNETGSIQDVAKASSLLNTVDYRTETRVTTVEVVNYISNISVPTQTLKDILNKVQQMPLLPTKTADDYIEAIDHKPKEIVSNKQDDKLEIARKNLAKLRAIEHKNEDNSCKHVENIIQKDTENPLKIEITTGPNGEYIAQVISVSNDGSSVETEHIQVNCSISNTEQISASNNENISHSHRIQETEVLERNQSIKNNQKLNEASETREIIRNETCDESNGSIDETLFFKYQINFFRLVQERLSENNSRELADELSKDIHDLITISDDEGAKADMKYKCHVCRNIAIYSPRSLYYNVTNHLENSLDKRQNCPLCITFRKKYIDILIKYIEIEAPKEKKTSLNTAQRNDAIVHSSDMRRSESENSRHNQEHNKIVRPKDNCDIENQLSLITNSVPFSPKKAKVDDQARPNPEHILHVSKNTQEGKTNDFVVKLPRNMLKESTLKALISKREKATLSIATDDNSNQDNNSGNREPRNIINAEMVTSTIAELHNRNVNDFANNIVEKRGLEVGTIIDAAINRIYRIPNDDGNEANPRKIMKSISVQDATGTKIDKQNTNAIYASDNNKHNDKNQKTLRTIWRSVSAETATNTNNGPQTKSTSSDNNEDTVKNHETHPKKRASVETATGINLEPQPKNANVTANDDRDTDKSHEKLRKITKSIVETTSINNSDHDDKHQKHRKRKSISAETTSSATSKNTLSSSNSSDENNKNKEGNREGPNITNAERSNVTTNTKHNDNNLVRNRESRESIDTETSSISKTTTNSNTANTEAKKSESAKAPQATGAIAEKDDVSRSEGKRGNNAKIRNDVENDDANDGRKTSDENYDENGDGDKDIQKIEKALDDSLKTLKENCNSNQELPKVKISGKKQNKKGTKSKEHEPFEEITYEYRCKVCWYGFKYLSSCLKHMNKNHNIQNPVVPVHCITMGCAFCDLFVMPKLYNTHIKTAHSDKYFEKE